MKKETVFVTGASRGIGRAIALYFAGNGHPVIINSSQSKQALLETKEAVLSFGVPCLSFLCDIKDYNSVKNIFDEARMKLGSVDILVNNAGISHIGLFQDMTPYEFKNVVDTNLLGPMNCTHLAVPDMVRKKAGVIINISSVWGAYGASCEAVYSASKGGLNSFTKALARELAPSNIQVNAIACGLIDTDMNKCFSEAEINAICEEIPAQRVGKPEEVAKLVYMLATGRHTYLTGQVINIDGGWQ